MKNTYLVAAAMCLLIPSICSADSCTDSVLRCTLNGNAVGNTHIKCQKTHNVGKLTPTGHIATLCGKAFPEECAGGKCGGTWEMKCK